LLCDKAFPDPAKLRVRLSGNNPLNTSMIAPAAVLRLRKKNDYEPEVLYFDDGSLITILTGAAIDPVRKKMIAGGVVERHFIVCDMGDVDF
jgi:arylesterase/paraoxonase